MNCSPFDLRDYFLEELAESDRRQVELHVRSCAGCSTEVERLRITHATLLTLREEEVPQRIGFVSDKVFEPSPVRRAWQAFWGSSARLGFASAAMLSAALLSFTFFRPGAGAPLASAPPDTARVEAVLAQRVNAAVERAVSESEARQARKTVELVAAAEQRFAQHKAEIERAAEEYGILQKRYNVMLLASNEQGGSQ